MAIIYFHNAYNNYPLKRHAFHSLDNATVLNSIHNYYRIHHLQLSDYHIPDTYNVLEKYAL